MKPEPGVWDGRPVFYTHREAWVFALDSWVRVESVEVSLDGQPLSEKAFAARFPNLPPLPEEAFQSYRDARSSDD
jgi:hypothetical protein